MLGRLRGTKAETHPSPSWPPYSLDGEYLDFAEYPPITTDPSARMDAEGIPMVRYGDAHEYNPVTVSQYGLREWSLHVRSGDGAHREEAVRMAHWLARAQDRDSGAWYYRFEVAPAGLKLPVPWISAMAQGQSMSLLARANRAGAPDELKQAALRALGPLRKRVEEGGVVRHIFDRWSFYEEYPTEPPTFVLNGFMYTLVGLHDLSQLAPDSDAGDLFAAGEETLARVLPLYDSGGHSIYDLSHFTLPPREAKPTTPLYNTAHVQLLAALHSIRPRQVYEFYRDLWSRDGERPAGT